MNVLLLPISVFVAKVKQLALVARAKIRLSHEANVGRR